MSSADVNRADLLRVLANPDVKAVADKAGLEVLGRATTAVTSPAGTGTDAIGGPGAPGR